MKNILNLLTLYNYKILKVSTKQQVWQTKSLWKKQVLGAGFFSPDPPQLKNGSGSNFNPKKKKHLIGRHDFFYKPSFFRENVSYCMSQVLIHFIYIMSKKSKLDLYTIFPRSLDPLYIVLQYKMNQSFLDIQYLKNCTWRCFVETWICWFWLKYCVQDEHYIIHGSSRSKTNNKKFTCSFSA